MNKMMVVKVKNDIKKNDNVRFEILSRNPLNNHNFVINKDIFNKLFTCAKNDMILKNTTEAKDDIYNCVETAFPEKIAWWNKNIFEVDHLHTILFSKTPNKNTSIDMLDMFNTLLAGYTDGFGSTYPDFLKEMHFFKEMFDSGQVIYGE